MNPIDKVSVDLSILADRERYGMRAGMEGALRDAARELENASNSLYEASDEIFIAAIEIGNLTALCMDAQDDYAKNVRSRITEQVEILRRIARKVRGKGRGGES